MDILEDLNVLYESYKRASKSSPDKTETMRFRSNFLSEIIEIKDEFKEETYEEKDGSEFEIKERGKKRHIHGKGMKGKTVGHAYSDFILNDSLRPYLIHNNGASQKGKGVSFSRDEFESELGNAHEKYGDFIIVFGDFSKFYDNIVHRTLKDMIHPKVPKDTRWLFDRMIDHFRVDVSYMTDEEYATCIKDKFDSVEYYANIPKEKRTGEKFMDKSCNIGDQISQDVGVFYPTPIDNYVKIVCSCKFYGRYMDDFYYIVKTKEEADMILAGIRKQADKLGIFINEKKTHSVRSDERFRYLQIRYFLKGKKVVKRLRPESVTRERRRLKAYKRLLDKGEMDYQKIKNCYKSWMGAFYKIMSRKQIRNMKALYKTLFKEDPRWKKQKSLSAKQKSKPKKTAQSTLQMRDSIMTDQPSRSKRLTEISSTSTARSSRSAQVQMIGTGLHLSSLPKRKS